MKSRRNESQTGAHDAAYQLCERAGAPSLGAALPGDTIYFHVVSAVRVGRQMVIPRGAFVEATISNLDEREVNGRLEVRLRFRRLIEAGGDIADLFAVDASPNDSAYRRDWQPCR